MKNEFFLNAFTRVTLEGIRLGEMQVANPRFSYSLVDADKARAEIDMHVRPMREFDMIRSLYHSPATGYLERDDGLYYRNCHIINDMDWPEVFYRGRLPGSYLRIRFESFDPFRVDVQFTQSYLRQSRSRLMRIGSLDETINHLLLVLSIFRGYMPMHAAAIEVGRPEDRFSVLFMGFPNTGKTNASVAARKALSGEYLAEDICFVRPDTLAVLGGPFTLDETKIQNYAELRADKFIGAPLKQLVFLQRKREPEALRSLPPGDHTVADFMLGMNRYEFEWNHDVLVCHLLIGGASHGISNTAALRLYMEGLQTIGKKTEAIELTGMNPARWTELLVNHLGARIASASPRGAM